MTQKLKMNINDINPQLTIQEVKLEADSLRFVIPFSMSVSGPSQSNFLIKIPTNSILVG